MNKLAIFQIGLASSSFVFVKAFLVIYQNNWLISKSPNLASRKCSKHTPIAEIKLPQFSILQYALKCLNHFGLSSH